MSVAHAFFQSIICYFIFINVCYVVLLITSLADIVSRCRKKIQHDTPAVTALVPAYNEEKNIINAVESLLASDYKNLKIIVINDGSQDNTAKLLIERYDLIVSEQAISSQIPMLAKINHYYISEKNPHLVFIDKEHSGKSDSLNIGINACMSPLFVSIDGDTIIEPDAISSLVTSALRQPNTIATGGSVHVLNGCDYKNGQLLQIKISFIPLVAMQICEYLRAMLFERADWNIFNGPLMLSGAITLFESKTVIAAGGYLHDSPGEDREIIFGLHEYMRQKQSPCHIDFTICAAAFTFVPMTIRRLWSQRIEWHQGLVDSLLRHTNMFFNPRFGATGMVTYPFLLLVEFLSPVIELISYIAIIAGIYFNIIDWRFVLLFLLVTWGFSTLLTFITIAISLFSFNKYKRVHDIFYLLISAIFENIGYRQILVLCRVYATCKYFINLHKGHIK